jgi:hypothetical protein
MDYQAKKWLAIAIKSLLLHRACDHATVEDRRSLSEGWNLPGAQSDLEAVSFCL